jgi:Phosphotransferase enzyme family
VALNGGYASKDVRLYELVVAGRPMSVVWKRTVAREVAALRAVDQVPGVGGPWLLAHGGFGPDGGAGGRGDTGGAGGPGGGGSAGGGGGAGGSAGAWVLMPHHAGTSLTDGQPVPDAAYEILARVHAHHRGGTVPGVPVVDAAFWRRLCLHGALPAVRRAAVRGVGSAGSAEPERSADAGPAGSVLELFRAAEARLLEWSSDERMLTALSVLPATLAHGDLHRGNILEGADGAVIIDWGGARIAPGGLDLAVLAEQGGVDHDRYRRRLAELTGRPVAPALVEVEQHWALAMGYVQYLGFAADCLGPDRVGVMIDRAARAFTQLGVALTHLQRSAERSVDRVQAVAATGSGATREGAPVP